MNKKKWAAVIGVLLVSGLALGAYILLSGPSSEELNVIRAINDQKRVIDHNGHVEDVTISNEARDDGVMPFEAKILNEQGTVIGTVKGQRVEGFGTVDLRYAFEGEPADPEHQHRGGDHRRGQQGQQAQDGHGGDRPLTDAERAERAEHRKRFQERFSQNPFAPKTSTPAQE